VPVVRRLLACRSLALLLLTATLVLRLLVPAGYMVGTHGGRLSVELCSGIVDRPMAAAMPDMSGPADGHGHGADHGKAEMPCAFSGLFAASLGAVDPVQLVLLIAFIMGMGRLPAARPVPRRRLVLRPPLRGPPVRL